MATSQAGRLGFAVQPVSSLHGPQLPPAHAGVGFAHCALSWQPWQEPASTSQAWPAAQAVWLPAVHWTQRPVARSQAGVPAWPAQPRSDVQGAQAALAHAGVGFSHWEFCVQATHLSVAPSQTRPAGQAAASAGVHWTQRPEARSQAGVPAWPAQPASDVQGAQAAARQVGVGFAH